MFQVSTDSLFWSLVFTRKIAGKSLIQLSHLAQKAQIEIRTMDTYLHCTVESADILLLYGL